MASGDWPSTCGSEAGHALFLDLARGADIVIDNYREGVLERLRIDYASLRAVKPEIITISLTGFGEGGPLGSEPGFDPVLQAFSGMMHAQGGDSDPVFMRLPVNDVAGAATLALGAVLALLHQRRGGGGQRGWTSLAGQSGMMQSDEIVRYDGRRPSHRGGADFAGPDPLDRYYRTRDGWLRLQAVDVAAARDGAAERAAALAALRDAGLLSAPPHDDDALQEGLCRAIGGSGYGRRRAPLHGRRPPGDARAQRATTVQRPVPRGRGGAAPVGSRRAGAGRAGVAVHRRALGPLQPHREDRRARPARAGGAHAGTAGRDGPRRGPWRPNYWPRETIAVGEPFVVLPAG